MTTDGPAEVSAAPPARSGRGLLLSLVITDVVILLDVLTKHWAVSTLAGEPPHHVVWTLQWNLAYNTGMAFSSGKGMGPVIGVLALAIGIAMLVAVRRQPSRLARVAAGLVAGGAFGNVIDRLFRGEGWLRGAVVDFIDFQWFPIFNVADMAVNVGGALFVLWSLLGQEHEQATTPADVGAGA
ncbi:MAG: signal peptidase II [Ilumatobacteraceae bacterium]